MVEDEDREELPAWSLAEEDIGQVAVSSGWPQAVSREWAWGDAGGAGVTVCLLDSGIALDHPRVGTVQASFRVRVDGEKSLIEPDDRGDVSGHGTACAGVVRALAPDCELVSVRVLGEQVTGTAGVLLAGLEWAIAQCFDVINLSLSTRRRDLAEALYQLADRAYFGGSMLVCSAHNLLVESFPWRFSSVMSVASHERADSEQFFYNPRPPVEFFARGLDVPVAWPGGRTAVVTGNSFATPHMAGMCARILGEHPNLTPFQVKTMLHLIANNVHSRQQRRAA